MTQALYINDRETYELYTEMMEDHDRAPLEYTDIDTNFLVFDENDGSPKVWYMTPFRFHEKWKIAKKQTSTSFADVTSK